MKLAGLGAGRVQKEESLPAGWAWATVRDIGAVRLGRQRSPDKQSGRYPVPYLRAANVVPTGLDLNDVLEMDFTPAEQRVFALQRGDLVLAEASGSAAQVGRAAVWNDELPGCCYQNTIIRFRPHGLTSQYALLVFQHFAVAGIFANAARGVGILHLGATRFADLVVPVPPMAEQVRVSEIVDKRRLDLRQAAESLQSARSLIDEQTVEVLSAAVAGELIETEAALALREGRAPEMVELAAEVKAAESKRSAQATLFENGDELETGTIPDRPSPPGWIWLRVDKAGDVALGKMREPKRHHGANMRPYLRVANVLEDRIDVADVKSMHFEPEEIEAFELKFGDILLNEGQSPELVGRPAMYRDELPGACFQKTLLRFRAGPLIEPEFALIVFRHYLHSGAFKEVAHWSTNIAHLTRRRFAAMPFPIPTRSEQCRIVAEVSTRLDAARAQRAAVQTSLDRLPEMMAELLSAAVSGALTRQQPEDEPATELLARLGPPPLDTTIMQDEEETPIQKIMSAEPDDPRPTLSGVLRAAREPVSLPDLCRDAGYDRNSTADIERFYVELHDVLGRTVEVVGDARENATLKAIVDAAR